VESIPNEILLTETAAEEEEQVEIYYSPEVREMSKRSFSGRALLEIAEKHAELKELIEKVKDVFKVDENRITFNARAL
jgi:hypothetical protein